MLFMFPLIITLHFKEKFCTMINLLYFIMEFREMLLYLLFIVFVVEGQKKCRMLRKILVNKFNYLLKEGINNVKVKKRLNITKLKNKNKI